jgi:hypothetical protein
VLDESPRDDLGALQRPAAQHVRSRPAKEGRPSFIMAIGRSIYILIMNRIILFIDIEYTMAGKAGVLLAVPSRRLDVGDTRQGTGPWVRG